MSIAEFRENVKEFALEQVELQNKILNVWVCVGTLIIHIYS